MAGSACTPRAAQTVAGFAYAAVSLAVQFPVTMQAVCHTTYDTYREVLAMGASINNSAVAMRPSLRAALDAADGRPMGHALLSVHQIESAWAHTEDTDAGSSVYIHATCLALHGHCHWYAAVNASCSASKVVAFPSCTALRAAKREAPFSAKRTALARF